MEELQITTAQGLTLRCNPSNARAIKAAVWGITKNQALADDIAEWADIASIGNTRNYPLAHIRVAIVPPLW